MKIHSQLRELLPICGLVPYHWSLYFIRRSKTCVWFSDYPEGPFAEAVGAIVCLLVGALRNCRGMLAFFLKVAYYSRIEYNFELE